VAKAEAVASPVVKAKLQEANLQEANLQESNLQVSKQPEPKTQEAKLQEPRLQEAKRLESKPQVAAAAKPQRLAMATPATQESIVRKHAMPPPADTRELSLPGSHSHTAIYDIEAHTVYLPDGERLEAHSGLGNGFDNPRYVDVRMHGPTPPNVYDLTLREQIFHGVRAIRLNPVDEDKMHGRAGMLAHSYMLGPSGASFGCVSFKDYPAFLHAYLNGEVDRLIVVAHLDNAPAPVARADSRDNDMRYAYNNR
jgi:Tlde1 domain